MIYSDWHIHTDASYDAKLPLETLIAAAKEQELRGFGIADHLNYNDEKFWGDIRKSSENFHRLKATCPSMRLGVELTPIAKPYFDYIARTGSRDGYVAPLQDKPYDIELAGTKEELMALGIQYAVGASHWRVDVPDMELKDSDAAQINEWHRQQMYLACDERVTILGHPWACNNLWLGDFSIVPSSMHDELAAALVENGKYAECNVGMFTDKNTSELFRNQYAEFLRSFFERGIPITYGSDCHGNPDGSYPDKRMGAWAYLEKVGFKAGEIAELSDDKLWQ